MDRHPASHVALESKIADLTRMPVGELRGLWRQLYRREPPHRLGRALLEHGVAWKLQARVQGDLSRREKRRLADLVQTLKQKGDLTRRRTRRLKPGTHRHHF